MKFIEKESKNMWSFLLETFEFTEEQNNAMDHQIPMTQEIYNSILDKCIEIGSDMDPLFYRMLIEYQDFMENYAEKIVENVKDIEFFDGTEETVLRKENLYAKINAKYGEGTI